MSIESEPQLQQKVAKALYKSYKDCVDGFIGFTDIALALGAPDFVLLSQEQMCEGFYTVTIFEVKTSLDWESLGQLYRYRIYAPTYVAIPLNEAEELKRRHTMFQALKGLGVGIAAIDSNREGISIILGPGKSLAAMEQILIDAILWQVLRNILSIDYENFSKIYTIFTEFLQRELRPTINVDKIPTLGKEDKQIIKAIINALSLQKKVLPLSENPHVIELLDLDIFKLSSREFMNGILLSKPLARLTSFVIAAAKMYRENIPVHQCYALAPILLLYTKGLPLQLIRVTYDSKCQDIYEDLSNLYRNMMPYMGIE